mmetsp:Transcript_124075/g.356267  ORF Transcript_124075/g.356267 Transcript_124075/m.356267 type:complete len:278 (+) Transcript_124075:554-1387(+)
MREHEDERRPQRPLDLDHSAGAPPAGPVDAALHEEPADEAAWAHCCHERDALGRHRREGLDEAHGHPGPAGRLGHAVVRAGPRRQRWGGDCRLDRRRWVPRPPALGCHRHAAAAARRRRRPRHVRRAAQRREGRRVRVLQRALVVRFQGRRLVLGRARGWRGAAQPRPPWRDERRRRLVRLRGPCGPVPEQRCGPERLVEFLDRDNALDVAQASASQPGPLAALHARLRGSNMARQAGADGFRRRELARLHEERLAERRLGLRAREGRRAGVEGARA